MIDLSKARTRSYLNVVFGPVKNGERWFYVYKDEYQAHIPRWVRMDGSFRSDGEASEWDLVPPDPVVVRALYVHAEMAEGVCPHNFWVKDVREPSTIVGKAKGRLELLDNGDVRFIKEER